MPDLLRCRIFRMHWGWRLHRCGSSASTSATCRAPTWWVRWWCSRTGCRANPSIAEVTRRRFLRHLSDQSDPNMLSPEGKSRRFAYPPNLFVVDGGAPQVNAASAVLDELGITDVAVIGLAKRLEEGWVPSEPDPIIMPRNSEGLYLLQRVRDEAHRFAITYHRSKRSKRMTASALDAVPGLGEHRRKALVAHFGSLARL